MNHSSFGPVLVVRGKLPTTPDTYEDAAVMGSGQLRFWSLCTNHGPSRRSYACLADDQIRTDGEGNYTIGVSAAAGPNVGYEALGINWLSGGPTNDKALILRNMLPDPSFTRAIQNADFTPQSVEATLGPYSPAACYTTVATFEAMLGCA